MSSRELSPDGKKYYVANGLTNKEVARALKLSEKTVKHYMTSILQKLHLRNRVEAAMLAREHLKV